MTLSPSSKNTPRSPLAFSVSSLYYLSGEEKPPHSSSKLLQRRNLVQTSSVTCAPSYTVPGAPDGYSLPAMQETWARALDWGNPLEKSMATHSSIPAWQPTLVFLPAGSHGHFTVYHTVKTADFCVNSE